jgi:hypothetical protein
MRKYYPKTSLHELKNIIGYADHASVIHGVSTCRDRMITADPEFMKLFVKAETTLKKWIEAQSSK